MHLVTVLLLLMPLVHLFGEDFQLHPPKKWQCINDKSQLPNTVEAIYIGKGKGKFTPSINVAKEETKLSLKDYTALAKRYHEAQPRTLCTLLGPIITQSGPAELMQIDKQVEWGSIRFLQATFVDTDSAYVITATCLADEFNTYYMQFLDTIKSFRKKG